jgi:plastocyanin
MRSSLLLAAILGCATSAKADEKYVTIRGQVKWNGEKAPEVALVNLAGHPDKAACCVAGPLASNVLEVDAKSLGVKNVVVWLRPDDKIKDNTFPLAQVKPELAKPKSVVRVIDQPMCQFEPKITIARAGDTLVVKNSAKIPHNVNYSSDNGAINQLVAAGGEMKLPLALAAQRLPISVACNIHPWMTAQVRVFDHPYYALTDKDGKFEIKDVPVGTWRIVYQHEMGLHQSKPENRDGNLGFPTAIKGDKAVQELDAIKLQFYVPKPPQK